ncbi:FAD-binding oxidoreductase [Cohnella pontilimi]|uniref:FAD-binding oxidoreductase n=1 Tax=Cohnella pontilimi TaxID=2564100 RepID=A0A4U0FDA1_9BACL|nr:FAD-dependent oxidoreductase [Cohnella pontilimi]TJY42688.1 FAD-binding oxidoreductase [Cohnella pontilimi]
MSIRHGITHARQPRKLHDGTLYWPKTMPHIPAYPMLRRREETEVAIVGGGLTGAICAAMLARSGIPCVLIEGKQVASGSTAANTGLIQFCSDIMLSELMGRIGEKNAVMFYHACRKALVTLAQLSSDTGEDTGFYTRSSLYCASCEDDVAKLIREYTMLRKYDFPVSWGIPARVGGKISEVKAGALTTHGDAEINPLRLTHALLAYAVRLGARVYENTGVLEVGRMNGRFTLLCQEGEILARRVVKATGYLPGIVTPSSAGAPILKRSFALATVPGQVPDEWPDHYMMWETARPYFYFRTTPDGRILAGGSDDSLYDPTCDGKLLTNRTNGLLAQLGELFPGHEWQVEDAWCGTFGESSDDLPFLGEHPDQPGIHHALSTGGNGTIYSVIAASLLQDRILGRDNRLSSLLSPGRRTVDASYMPHIPNSPDHSASLFA